MIRVILVLLLLATATTQADELTGTLKAIKDKGSISIGYRTDAPPFSFENENGNAQGYSVALCQMIAAAVKDHLGLNELGINYVALEANERIEAVTSGKVDIECGNTTITLGRRAEVDFTLMTFVTGGAYLAKRSSAMGTMRDLDGKRVGVIEGTTTAAALNEYLELQGIDADVVFVSDRTDGKQQLDTDEIDALASDRAVLIGQVLGSDNIEDYALSNELFSFEPFALMLRRNDPDFRLVADRSLAEIFSGAKIGNLYEQWLEKAGVQTTPMLMMMYQIQALPD